MKGYKKPTYAEAMIDVCDRGVAAACKLQNAAFSSRQKGAMGETRLNDEMARATLCFIAEQKKSCEETFFSQRNHLFRDFFPPLEREDVFRLFYSRLSLFDALYRAARTLCLASSFFAEETSRFLSLLTECERAVRSAAEALFFSKRLKDAFGKTETLYRLIYKLGSFTFPSAEKRGNLTFSARFYGKKLSDFCALADVVALKNS